MYCQVVTKKEVTSALTNMHSGKGQEQMDVLAAVGGSPEALLANVVRGIEGKMEDRAADDERGAAASPRPGRVFKRSPFFIPTVSEHQNNKYDFQICFQSFKNGLSVSVTQES